MNSLKMTLLLMCSRSSGDRAPAMFSGGHGCDSCRGLTFFFVSRSCNIDQFTFRISLSSLKFLIFIYLSQNIKLSTISTGTRANQMATFQNKSKWPSLKSLVRKCNQYNHRYTICDQIGVYGVIHYRETSTSKWQITKRLIGYKSPNARNVTCNKIVPRTFIVRTISKYILC